MNYRYIVAFLLISTTLSSHLYAEEKLTWEEKKRDQAWFKKRLNAAEKVDKFITALLVGSATSYGVSKNPTLSTLSSYINPVPVTVRQYNPYFTALLGVGKVGITLRRMYLHDRYVGWNPLKMISSMVYFMIVDMASWTSK